MNLEYQVGDVCWVALAGREDDTALARVMDRITEGYGDKVPRYRVQFYDEELEAEYGGEGDHRFHPYRLTPVLIFTVFDL